LSRIDLCFDSGEALIEEIQSDCCSEIADVKKYLSKNPNYLIRYWDIKVPSKMVITYLKKIKNPKWLVMHLNSGGEYAKLQSA